MISLFRRTNFISINKVSSAIFGRFFSENLLTSDIMYNKHIDDLMAERQIIDGNKPIQTRILHVGLCGAPNSGKSTLMNSIVGKKISAVSHKVNTTRLEILGVKNINNTQLIFHDTPGILQKSGSSKEEKELTEIAKETLSKMDVFLTVIDGFIPLTYLSKEVIHTAAALSQSYDAKLLFALNKVDLIKDRKTIPERKRQIAEEIPILLRSSIGLSDDGKEIISLSALSGQGIKQIEQILVNEAHIGYWIYSPGVTTNRSQEEQVNEVIREKAFHYLNQEIPYELIFVNNGWKKMNGVLTVMEELVVQSKSQLRIVNGLKRRIEQSAAKDLTELFNRTIRVNIVVTIDKNKDENVNLSYVCNKHIYFNCCSNCSRISNQL